MHISSKFRIQTNDQQGMIYQAQSNIQGVQENNGDKHVQCITQLVIIDDPRTHTQQQQLQLHFPLEGCNAGKMKGYKEPTY